MAVMQCIHHRALTSNRKVEPGGDVGGCRRQHLTVTPRRDTPQIGIDVDAATFVTKRDQGFKYCLPGRVDAREAKRPDRLACCPIALDEGHERTAGRRRLRRW